MKKHGINLLEIRRVVISLGFLVAALAPVLVAQETEPVGNEEYSDHICIRDISDFEAVFLEHQFDYLWIVPPFVEFILVQPCYAPLFFDPNDFPKTFSDNLIGEYTKEGIPEYEVRVYEDPTTREIKFVNDANQLLEALAAPMDYNPYSYVSSFYPALYTSSYSDTERDWLKALYDPSRVQGVFWLIPLEYADQYMESVKKQMLRSKPGRIKDEPIVRRSSGSSNELWLAISNMFDGGNVEISINVPTGIQTNHLEIYTTEALLPFWWDIAASNLVAGLGTNVITWTHDSSTISNKTVLYYTAGNVDVDSDGDGLADTHERFLHHTDPGDTDTDDDYSPDGYEVAHSTDPLSATSFATVSVSGTIISPDFGLSTVRVFAAISSNDWESPYWTTTYFEFFMAGFEITNVPGGGKYWLRAYYDADQSGSADSCDPHGEYTNIWISITNDMVGINIYLGTDQTAPVLQLPTNTTISCGESLEPTNTGEAVATDDWSGVLLLTHTDTVTVVYSNFDRNVTRKWTAEDYCTNSVTATQSIHRALCDLDADGLPDEWEQQIVDFDPMDGITNVYDVVSTNDFDEDGLTNGEEFELGTDPTALDTDLDWAGDAYEVAEEADPTDYSSTPALRMVINDNDLYTESTWLSLSFPGLVADTMNISESWNMSNSTVAVKSEPTTFILPSDSNGLRKVYVKLVRASDGQISPRLMSSIRLDTEPPAVEIASPTNDWRTSRRWIFIEGTATDTVSGVRVLVNDEYVDGMADCEYQHNRLHLQEGTNLIAVVGTDAAGNAATQTVSVIQDFSDDTNAPIFTMNLPLDYEVSGGVTNWLDTTTYGSNEVLFLNGSIDDETAEIQFLVIGGDVTNGPFAGRAAGTQLWGRVELLPGTNSLIVLADDAAGNVATCIYTIVRNTGMVFEITYPAAYQTLNASSVTVYGVASPFFSNAVITVNGIACSITDNGSNITFATVEPVPLSAGRNSISGLAEVNGRVYYTDPEHFGYEILKYRAQYDDYWDDDWDGDPPVMLRYLYTWDNQTQLYIDERYKDGVLVRHTNYYKPTLDWENGDAYCDFEEGTWDSYNLSKSTLRHIDYNYKSWLHFTKHWPTQEVQMVIFQFIDLEYERAPGVEIDPSLITYRGQTGFWYNGHVSFIVPIKTDTEYVIKQEDFMIGKEYGWPDHDYEVGPYTNAGFSTVYLEHSYGHWLWFRYFTNDVLKVDLESIEFTSDHNSLKKNPTSGSVWGDSSTDYETPEWVATSRNNPISHTKNTKISATVTVKVEPAGINFDLIGDGPDGYVDFEKTGQTSTGADQPITVTADANLPDEVSILNKSINWKIKVGSLECDTSSSGSHKIYVTHGTPAGSVPTEKRVEWVCATCDGESSLSAIADDIYNALASEPPRFQLQSPNVPSPLWLLMESVSYQGQCIDLANLMKFQVEMVGGQGSIGYVYGSTDSDCFSTSSSAYESRSCTNTNHPGSEVIRVWSAGGWNNWEAVCQVLSTCYAVKLDEGAAIEILRNWLGSNTIGGNYQAWRYYDPVLQSWATCTDPGPCPVPKP